MLQLFIVLIVLFLLEILYFKIANRFNIIDKPNERSSHSEITLRGGGVIFYFSFLLFFLLNNFEYPYFFIGLTIITTISFLDDIFTLSNKIRLIFHLISVLLLLYQINFLEVNLFLTLISIILIIGTINAYNFMDGINGITAVYSLVILALLFLTNFYVPFVNSNFITYVFLGVLVFSFYNFRQKAICFAGDVGSVSIAFIIVFLIIKLIVTTQNLMYILYLLIYGVDTFWTIIKRLLNKENIFKAHRTHLYQYLANEAKYNKLVVSIIYALLQLIIGLLVFYIAFTQTLKIQIIISVIIISLTSLYYIFLKNKLEKKYKP